MTSTHVLRMSENEMGLEVFSSTDPFCKNITSLKDIKYVVVRRFTVEAPGNRPRECLRKQWIDDL